VQGFEIPAPLRGIIPPLVTPLAGEDRLDRNALARLLEHLIAGGVSGVFALGTNGEAPSLGPKLQRQVLEETCRAVDGRLPVLAGITGVSLQESLHLAEHAAQCGAQAVVAAPPFYYPLGQEDLLAYYRQLADRLPLPLLLYDIPSHAGNRFEVATVAQLMPHPNIIGIKDSTGDMIHFHRLCRLVETQPEFNLLVGPEEMLPDVVLAGAHGGVCGGANALPSLYVQLYRAAEQGDLVEVRRLHNLVLRFAGGMVSLSGKPTAFLCGLKAALAALELCGPVCAPPLQSLTTEQMQSAAQLVREVEQAFSAGVAAVR